MRRGQALERIERSFRLALLQNAHDGVENHDEQNQAWLEKRFRVALNPRDDKRHDCRRDEDQDHHILELIQKSLQIRFLLLFLKNICAVFLKTLFRFSCGQAVFVIGMQCGKYLFRRVCKKFHRNNLLVF